MGNQTPKNDIKVIHLERSNRRIKGIHSKQEKKIDIKNKSISCNKNSLLDISFSLKKRQ